MKKIVQWLLYSVFLIVTVIILLELSYRYQVIDFYNRSFLYLNKNEDTKNAEPDVLIIGDSFSAQPNGYIDQLREAYPDLKIINSAVPGTGVRQHQLILEKRLRRYTPKKVLYQVYVGNDLTDVTHPINFKSNGILRNVYWAMSDRLLVVPFINARLGRFKSPDPVDHTLHSQEFGVAKYTARCKFYLRADHQIINNSVQVKGDMKVVYDEWIERFQKFKETLPQSTELAVLIIPHCSQVNSTYQRRFEMLGAKFEEDFQKDNYPFIVNFKNALPAVAVINPMKELREVDEPYFVNDPHLSPIGQRKLYSAVTMSEFFGSTKE